MVALHEDGETHHLVIRTVYGPMTNWASWQRRATPAALQAGPITQRETKCSIYMTLPSLYTSHAFPGKEVRRAV